MIDSKKIKGKLHYLIRWKGFSADSDTWEPDHTLSCPELINKFIDEVSESVVLVINSLLGTVFSKERVEGIVWHTNPMSWGL